MWNDPLALNRLSMLLLVLVLGVAAYAGARRVAAMPVFAIRTLEVRGAQGTVIEHVTAERVARECVPRIRGTLFTASLTDIKLAFEALPWVRGASVRRQWPGRLVIELEEHRALARWNDEAGNRFVSVRGEAFQAPGEAKLAAGLPLLTGPEGSEAEVVRIYEALIERLRVLDRKPSAVNLSPRQAWSARLSDGMTLELGREQGTSSVISRVERFVALYPATVAQLPARAEVADLRYPNGFAVKVPGLRTAPVAKTMPTARQPQAGRKAPPRRRGVRT